jgi:inosose dehydratase
VSRFELGFAPIAWNNEDLPGELRPVVEYDAVLDEIAAAGYSATELGDGFPRDPQTLRRALQGRGLTMPSAWCGLDFFQTSADADLEHTRRVCELLRGAGAAYVNLADQGTAERKAFACRTDDPAAPRLNADQWDDFAERVCRAAEIAREYGLQAAFHQHAGTWVETADDLEQLLRRAPAPLVKLCLDVGHATCGGIDPLALIRQHPERVAYIHLKDVDGAVLETVRRERLSFDDAVRRRIFTELGRGVVDVPGLLAALSEIDYAGWLMIEQDSTWLAPIESAQVSREYMRGLGL